MTLSLLAPLALAAATVDGEAALRHAAALAALGPHPWGSPRAQVAALYVQAQLRGAGLDEVRLEPFETEGIRGTNVVGVLRGRGAGFAILAAHHDTAPAAPGAYDGGGGVGVLIEAARAIARAGRPPRTLMFVSFDGEESWATGGTTVAGSRAFVRGLGGEARHLAGVLVIEMCGWSGGTPVFHPIAYDDPMRPGRSVITPAWLLAALQDGARGAGAAVPVGDPWLSWVYQPAVRTFRTRLYGDDLAFLQAGLPATFVSDSSFTAFYPWYHQAADTPDRLDARALERMGRAVVAMAGALARVERGRAEPVWYSAFGRTVGGGILLLLAALAAAPGLAMARRDGALHLGARLVAVALFAVLLWRHPVPALWVFTLPLLVTAHARGRWSLLALLPLLALAGLGVAAWARDMVQGLWLQSWELALAAAGLGLLWAGRGGGGRAGPKKRAPRPGPRR